MITQNNLINWLRFTAKVLDDKECKHKIHRFIYRHYSFNNKNTSRLLYHKYWECK